MQRQGYFAIATTLLLATSLYAQLDLGALHTQTVKTGQPWAAIDTKVEDLTVNIQVNRGVVTTVASLTYTPGNGQVYEYACPQKCDPRLPSCTLEGCGYRLSQDLALDSLETAAGFQLADNTVITDMYLWVGDVKVRAALQDRALASAQYEDIVKRRRDPALIETWGNGSYNLRIFPNESRHSRKIEIEFVQGMENGGDMVKAVLPVLHRLAKVAHAGVTEYEKLPNRTIGTVSISAVAVDGKSYNLKWDGIGSGLVNSSPLKFSASNVAELKEGVLSVAAAGCAGCLSPWIAERNGLSYFGVRSLLNAKDVKFEAQPTERNFLLDVDTKDTLVSGRARKVALLSLKAYAAAPYAGNLGIADGKGGISYVFPAAVPMDADALRKAYDALRAWTPNADADAHATLKAYAKSRGAGSAANVAYLINNDTTPYYRWPISLDGTSQAGVQAEFEAWEKARSAFEDETMAALAGAKSMLFGFWNDYRLNRVATATGGFQVGSLHGHIYFPMRGGVVADVAAPDKPGTLFDIHLPPLFGPGRPDAWTIAGLDVKASGMAIENLVVLQAQRYWGFYEVMPMGGDVVRMAKRSSDLVAPWNAGTPDSVELRLSGQYKGSGTATFTVTGMWGGLRFSQDLKVAVPAASGSGAAGAGIWAYQQGEAWARGLMKVDIKAVQQLGKDYRIVNRQMSLLALEPGMELWTEMPGKDGGTGGSGGARELSAGAPASDSKVAFNGQSTASGLDKATLEEILNAAVGLQPGPVSQARNLGSIALLRAGAGLQLAWALPEAGAEAAEFRILSLDGKEAARLKGVRTASGYAAAWSGAKQMGAYFVVARAGSRTLIAKIVVR